MDTWLSCLICCRGSAKYGIWWLGLYRWRLMLKASWNEPLFSERYGGRFTIHLPSGWRLQSFLVPSHYLTWGNPS